MFQAVTFSLRYIVLCSLGVYVLFIYVAMLALTGMWLPSHDFLPEERGTSPTRLSPTSHNIGPHQTPETRSIFLNSIITVVHCVIYDSSRSINVITLNSIATGDTYVP